MKAKGRRDDLFMLITAGEAASHCRVSLQALRRWIRDGRLKAFQTPGRHARIDVAEFQRFLRECGMPPYPVGGHPTPRVLVVEDDPDVLSILTSLLAGQASKLAVETAADGYDALIKVGTFKPTLLILDVAMPRLDGLEVCRRLKLRPETRDIRILAVTGHTAMAASVLAAGAEACVTKPFDFDLMSKELERFLGSPGREPAMRRPG
jgi:two-component system OmpR family response regulator